MKIMMRGVNSKTYLITGVAGFIGYHIAERLLSRGERVIGVDNLNDYYDVSLKQYRLSILEGWRAFQFHKLDICDTNSLEKVFRTYQIDLVVHLAAQAGVKYSLVDPDSYIHSNIRGFQSLIEQCNEFSVDLFYASSSSVYGDCGVSFSEESISLRPKNLYAESKILNENLAQIYSVYGRIKTVGLRFFTVYGPLMRPDMAIWKFAKQISSHEEVSLFGTKTIRDFTYIEDLVDCLERLIQLHNEGVNLELIYNIGSGNTIFIEDVIRLIEKYFNKNVQIKRVDLSKEEMIMTKADIQRLTNTIGAVPITPFEVGLHKFLRWFIAYQ